jgi:predicted AAA+ superfamily ATPase
MEAAVQQYSRFFKVVLLTGARQVGKSTLLHHLLPNVRTFVFDPVQDLFGARRDPDLFLDSNPPPLVLDEIQFAPELLPALKRRVDASDRPGQYYLTGSQNMAVLRTVAESMAGRVGILNLEGFSYLELLEQSGATWLDAYLQSPETFAGQIETLATTPPLMELLWRGSLPGLLDLPGEIVPGYFRSYIQTYVERDVRLLENIRDLSSFDRFLGLSAALCGQEINASQLGREIGVAPVTARRWLDLLTYTFQWLELSPYHGNAIKRLSGKSKGYWRDTGLACYLQRISSPEALAVNPLFGALFETWVINTFHKLAALLPTPPHMYHWRTGGGAEVDLVLELNGRFFPIEIKGKTNLTLHDTRGIRAFIETYPGRSIAPALVIYVGRETFPLTTFATAVPWNIVLKGGTTEVY